MFNIFKENKELRQEARKLKKENTNLKYENQGLKDRNAKLNYDITLIKNEIKKAQFGSLENFVNKIRTILKEKAYTNDPQSLHRQ